MIKNYFRILKKPHAYLQTILKTPVKFQKDRTETVGGVKGTKYPLKTRNHAPRATRHAPHPTENQKQCPSTFLRKGGGQQNLNKTCVNSGLRSACASAQSGQSSLIPMCLLQPPGNPEGWIHWLCWGLINEKTSTFVGHFVLSPREREKRDRRDSKGDERQG